MPLGASRLSLLAYQAAVAAGGRTAKTLTANGNVEVSTLQSKFGGASARFFTTDATDGSTDTIVTNTSDDFIFSGDFTWETWVYIIDNSSNDTMTFLGNRGGFNANNLYIAARTVDNKWQWGNSTMGANITTQTFSYNTWYHIALVRNGMGTNNFTFYVNGVALQSDTDTNTLGGGGANFISIGGIDAATDSFGINGYMDEVRVSDNARYTTGFTPSTSAFANDDNTLLLVHCDGANGSTTFTDDTVTPEATGRTAVTLTANGNAQVDTAQSKFGGASLLLDGVGDYLSASNLIGGSDIGTGDVTIECWARLTDVGNRGIFQLSPTVLGSGEGTAAMAVATNGSSEWIIYSGGGGNTATASTNINTWQHIALVRSSGTTKLYINGTSIFSEADAYNYNLSAIAIGAYFSSGYTTTGNIDEFRVSNTARYTANFTPPANFANDANTLLLVHADGADGSTTFVDDNVDPFATGGYTTELTVDGTGYRFHVFDSESTDDFVASGAGTVDVMLIGGGGGGLGGQFTLQAGGGAGKVLLNSGVSVSGQSYTITAGTGATGGTQTATISDGGTTSAFGYTAIGGKSVDPIGTYAAQTGGNSGNGYSGGTGFDYSGYNSWDAGGGGAGATGNGLNAVSSSSPTSTNGTGGPGYNLTSFIGSGNTLTLRSSNLIPASLIIAEGGNGGRSTSADSTSFGSGSDGLYDTTIGGNGKSGAVIIRYQIS